jgi:acetyl esterase/lipase
MLYCRGFSPAFDLASWEVNMSQTLDISYAAQSSAQKLDVFLPEGGSLPYPVIAWFHPGGFFGGDKSMMMDILLPHWLARGYAVVGINYRLSEEARFPAQIWDAKASIRWIRANAGKYRLNPEMIAAWGCSAGATLAALLGTSAGVRELEDFSMGNPEQSSRISAVVDWYGPIDFPLMDPQLVSLGYKGVHNVTDSGESKLFGGLVTEFPEKSRAIDPITHITSAATPFYIQHGIKDDLVPYLQSVMLAEALKAAIEPEKVVLELVENAGHFSGVHQSTIYINKALDFLDKYLK